MNCSKTLQSSAGYEKMFLKHREKFGAASAVFSSWPACLFNPALERIKLSDEDNTDRLQTNKQINKSYTFVLNINCPEQKIMRHN